MSPTTSTPVSDPPTHAAWQPMRRAAALAMVAVTATLVAPPTFAQAYPAKPVRIVIAFSAGGTTDILARSVAQKLGDQLKQPFVIDNKPGVAATSAPRWWCARRPMATR